MISARGPACSSSSTPKRVAPKRKAESKKSPAKKSRSGKSRKVMSSNPVVYLIGFTETEKEEFKKKVPATIRIVEEVVQGLTHFIVKPVCFTKERVRLLPLYYGVLSSCWFLRVGWLKMSIERGAPVGEAEFQFSVNDIDVTEYKRRSIYDVSTVSFSDILHALNMYQARRMDNRPLLFSKPVFSNVVILSSLRTNEGKMRKQELRLIIEAGGGAMARDDAWRLFREHISDKTTNLISCVIIMNGESLERLDVSTDLVKRLLLRRIPVLFEQAITESIRNKAEELNRSSMLFQAQSYWAYDHTPKVIEFTNEESDIIFSCVDDATPVSSPASKVKFEEEDDVIILPEYVPITPEPTPIAAIPAAAEQSRTDTPKRAMPQTKKTSAVKVEAKPTKIPDERDNDENLFDEFEKELHVEKKVNEEREAELLRQIEEEQNSVQVVLLSPPKHTMPRNLSHTSSSTESISSFVGSTDVGLKSFSFGENFNLDELLSVDTSNVATTSWVDWRSDLRLFTPQIMENGKPPKQSRTALQQILENMSDELKEVIPSSPAHDVISADIASFYRNTLEPGFVLPSRFLTMVFRDIVMPAYGAGLGALAHLELYLLQLLSFLPPTDSEGRYFWLQVLSADSELPKAKKNQISPPELLPYRIRSVRKLITQIFTVNGSSSSLMELIVRLMEMDLFALQGGFDGILKDDDDAKSTDSLDFDKKFDSRERNACAIKLDHIPLAYLFFYDYNERRKRGIDNTSMKTIVAMVDLFATTKSAISKSLIIRLMACVLEGLRWYLSERLHAMRSGELTHELTQEIQQIARCFIKNGHSLEEFSMLFPIGWINGAVIDEQTGAYCRL